MTPNEAREQEAFDKAFTTVGVFGEKVIVISPYHDHHSQVLLTTYSPTTLTKETAVLTPEGAKRLSAMLRIAADSTDAVYKGMQDDT